MLKTTTIILLNMILICALYGQSPSDAAGTASNIFLRTNVSAKTAALGDAFTAIANDEYALYYNPSGLANIKNGAVGLNHAEWFQDVRMDNLIFGYNFDQKLGVAIGVSHLWMPSIQGKDEYGLATEDINVSSSIINLGLGYKIHSSFYLGLGVKYFNENLAGFSANGIAIDAGFYMHTYIRGLTFGASVQNIGGKVNYEVKNEKIPFIYRTGLAYKIPKTGLQIALDVVKSIDTDWFLASGIQFNLIKELSLRYGNQFRTDQAYTPGYGVGVNLDKYVFDYTYYAPNNLGSTHRIGFTFKFDISSNKSYKHDLYKSFKVLKSRPPSAIEYTVEKEKINLNWDPIYKAIYNVYVKLSKKSAFKKINKSMIKETGFEFKKPSGVNKIIISITSVVNSVESAFSKEVEIEI